MENKPEFEQDQSLQPENLMELREPRQSLESPRYGTVANQDTRWVYGNQEHQGGNPQMYVAEQRRLEEEKRAREKAEFEKASQARQKTASQSPTGFFSGSDFQTTPKPPYVNSENYFHNAPKNAPANPNFGPADMSGQAQSFNGGRFNGGPHYGGGKLPSRKGPIAMFVSGLLMFLIFAPLVFIGGTIVVVANANVVQLEKESEMHVPSEKGNFTILSVKQESPTKPLTCEASQDGSKLSDMVGGEGQESSQEKMFVYRSITDEKVDIKCTTENGGAPLEMSVIVDFSFTTFVVLFVVSTIVGILGFVFIIWGIIWWVQRNRLRRMVLMGF